MFGMGNISAAREHWFPVNIQPPDDGTAFEEPFTTVIHRLRGQYQIWAGLGLTPDGTTADYWNGRLWVTIEPTESLPDDGCARADFTAETWEVAWASAGCALAWDHPYLQDVAASEIVSGGLAEPHDAMHEVLDVLMSFFGRRHLHSRRHDRHRRR